MGTVAARLSWATTDALLWPGARLGHTFGCLPASGGEGLQGSWAEMGQQGHGDARDEALNRLTLARVLGIARDVARHARVTGQEEAWAIRTTEVSAMPRWSLILPDDARHPLRRSTREASSSPLPPPNLLGLVAAEPRGDAHTTVCVVLADGRALEVEVSSQGDVSEPKADADVDSPVSRALRQALALPTNGRDPVDFYCDLYAYVCSSVPLTDNPAVHAVLTDPLVALRAPAPSARALWLEVARERAQAGEDWLDDSESIVWSEEAPRLVAVAAHLLAAPSGFTLGEDPERALERLTRLLPSTSRRDFLAHPSARLVVPVLLRRCAAWGTAAPSWLEVS